MNIEVKENIEQGKITPGKTRASVPFNRATSKILVRLQGEYQGRFGKKITKGDMAGLVLDQQIKHFSWS
jgi:hypothetical protein